VQEIENDTAGKPADSALTNITSDGRNQSGRPRGPVKRPRIDLPDGDQLWPYYTDFAQDTGINRRSLQRMLKDVPTTVIAGVRYCANKATRRLLAGRMATKRRRTSGGRRK
jgi:hypothetical protein